jgi:hypothetical protein
MRNPWSGGFTDKAEWEFGTCQRTDGSYYGHPGKTCHKGVEAEKSVEKVKKLLSGSYAEYEASYGGFRDGVLKDSAGAQTDKILSSDLKSMNADDARARTAAKRTKVSLEEMDEFREAGMDQLADKIGTKKELFDDMKWIMVNDRVLISEGTLNEAWNGTDLSAKANQAYSSKDFGQSRVVVGEHPVPTHELKTQLFASSDRSLKGVTTKIFNNSFISLTSAKEDNKLNSGGFKSNMPNSSKPLSRYERSEVKTFVLKDRMGKGNNALPIIRNVQKEANQAKEKGMTKEEWIQSIIDGME